MKQINDLFELKARVKGFDAIRGLIFVLDAEEEFVSYGKFKEMLREEFLKNGLERDYSGFWENYDEIF